MGHRVATQVVWTRRRCLLHGGVAAVAGLSGKVLVACAEMSEDHKGGVSPEATSEATTGPSGLTFSDFAGAAGRPAPDFTWQHYATTESLGSTNMRLSDILTLGKPVVLNFWAGLCSPCRREMLEFQEAWALIKGRVNMVGVDVGRFTNLGSTDDAIKLIDELGVTYPLGTTSDAQVVRGYQILGMPASVLITAQGTILRTWNGMLDTSRLIELVAELEKASRSGI